MQSLKLLFGVCLLSLATVATAQYQTYVIDTYGGASLIPVVRQQLDDISAGGSVSIYQDKLVLRTTPVGYQAVQQLLSQIDTTPQPVLVTVRVGSIINSSNNINQGQVHINQRGVFVNGQFGNQQTSEQQNSLYQVQTLSGKPASISTNTLLSLAHPSQYIYTGGNQGRYGGQSGYLIQISGQTLIDSSQGITVIPRLLPNGQVEVQLTQIQDKLTGNQQSPIHSQQLNASISVAKGEWITVGSISQSADSASHTSSYVNEQQQPIQIKVD